MAITKIVAATATTPKVGIEVFFESLVQLNYFRVYVAGADGNFNTNSPPAAFEAIESLSQILTYCGITQDAKAWLASTPRTQAVQAIIKWTREKFIPKLLTSLNKLAIAPAAPFPTEIALLEDALKWTEIGAGPDGKFTAKTG